MPTWEGGEPRWSEEAIQAVGGSDKVKRAAGVSDWQGWGSILTYDNRVLSWSYGSCGGCDAYEDSQDPVADLAENITQYATAEEAELAFDGAQGW